MSHSVRKCEVATAIGLVWVSEYKFQFLKEVRVILKNTYFWFYISKDGKNEGIAQLDSNCQQ